MSTGLHKDLEIVEIHRFHAFTYASGSARLAASGFTTLDVGKVAWQTDDNSFWALVANSPAAWVELTDIETGDLSITTHRTLRQLIHFIDNGPAEGFASGAYREATGTVFPTAITWYDSSGVGKKKIVKKQITWTGANPTTIVWTIYDAAEVLLATVTDTITYSGAFETSRTRTIA